MNLPQPNPLPELSSKVAQALDLASASKAVAQAHHWRGRANQALLAGDAASALRCWHEVGKREPEAADARFYLGCCLALTQQPLRAGLLFESLAESPRVPLALRQRAARLVALLAPETAALV